MSRTCTNSIIEISLRACPNTPESSPASKRVCVVCPAAGHTGSPAQQLLLDTHQELHLDCTILATKDMDIAQAHAMAHAKQPSLSFVGGSEQLFLGYSCAALSG